MILITGASGHLGTAVIQNLLKKTAANQVAALVRDANKAAWMSEAGVTIHVGNYNDTASLDRAMQGIDKVLLIAGGDAPNGLEQHQNVVDAAQKAGVRCIAYTSRSLKDRSTLANALMERHFQTEDYILKSGLNYILFRNILYMDTIPTFVGPNALETGIQLSTGDGKVAFALRSDMGEAIANVLADGACDNRIYNFTGSESYSFADVATALTNLSGKPVVYTPIEQSAYEERLTERGLPEPVVKRISAFLIDIKNGQEEGVSSDLETALGRKPVPLKEGLKMLFAL